MTDKDALKNFKIVKERWLEIENMYYDSLTVEIDIEFIESIDRGIVALEKQIAKGEL